MKKLIPLTLLTVSLMGCVSTPKVSATARPETIINTKNISTVVQKLTELCDRKGLTIEDSGASSVTCSKEAPMAAQFFLQTKYGTPVQSKVRFNAFPVTGGIKVASNVWYETQNAFGQVNHVNINGGNGQEVLHSILGQAKLELEKGKKK